MRVHVLSFYRSGPLLGIFAVSFCHACDSMINYVVFVTCIPTQNVPPFLEKYRNPCWKESLEASGDLYAMNPYPIDQKPKYQVLKEKWTKQIQGGHAWRLRCLPYFLILGQPKSGTTDLYRKILLHPDVTSSAMKEPHWWTRRRYLPCKTNLQCSCCGIN